MTQARQMIPDGGIMQGNNQTGSDIAVKLAICEDTTNVDGIQLPTDHTSRVIGITNELIKSTYRGDVQRAGIAVATSNGAITKGDAIEAVASGQVQTLTGGGKAFAIANSTTTGSGQDVELLLGTPAVS